MFFFSATILNWQTLLQDNRIKNVVIESMRWLSDHHYCKIHGFVIMPNHIHILWSTAEDKDISEAEKKLTGYTAHQFKKFLLLQVTNELNKYRSTQNDRLYHFWERRPRSIKIESRQIAEQKLEYIHANPMKGKWQLCSTPEEYIYSSASFYAGQSTPFTFLDHYLNWC